MGWSMSYDEGGIPWRPRDPGPMDTIQAVRLEMSNIVREMRQFQIPSQIGTRITYVLDKIFATLVEEAKEDRLRRLEQLYAQMKGSGVDPAHLMGEVHKQSAELARLPAKGNG